jgi:hypothetical protein
VPAQHQRLDWKQQGLDAQQHRVHDTDGVDGMQHQTLECARLLCSNLIMVAGVGVDHATASGRHAIKAALIDRLQERENGAGSLHLLRLDKLLAPLN